MSFETFLNLIPKIALMINFEDLDLKESVDKLIQVYFQPLYTLIMEDTFFGSVKEIVSSEIDFQDIRQVFSVIPPITPVLESPLRHLQSGFFPRVSQGE